MCVQGMTGMERGFSMAQWILKSVLLLDRAHNWAFYFCCTIPKSWDSGGSWPKSYLNLVFFYKNKIQYMCQGNDLVSFIEQYFHCFMKCDIQISMFHYVCVIIPIFHRKYTYSIEKWYLSLAWRKGQGHMNFLRFSYRHQTLIISGLVLIISVFQFFSSPVFDKVSW